MVVTVAVMAVVAAAAAAAAMSETLPQHQKCVWQCRRTTNRYEFLIRVCPQPFSDQLQYAIVLVLVVALVAGLVC